MAVKTKFLFASILMLYLPLSAYCSSGNFGTRLGIKLIVLVVVLGIIGLIKMARSKNKKEEDNKPN